MHTITHIEIPAPDLDRAIEFYSTVFNWRISIQNEAYAYFMVEMTQTGGGLDATLKPAPKGQGPQICIDVDDIEITLSKNQEFGR